jgi:predicted dehydrogenase
MNIQPMNIGIIGCGNIFPAYANGRRIFRALHLKACADIHADAAAAKAKNFGLKAASIGELLGDPSIDLVVNLTVPKVHAKVGMKILEAGKHLRATSRVPPGADPRRAGRLNTPPSVGEVL